MNKRALTNKERFFKWEKEKTEKAMNDLIYSSATELVETLISIAIDDRNPNAINALLDRGFGKARQNIGLDGGAPDKPIVFMPAQLMEKYAIKAAQYTELNKEQGDETPAGMLVEPIGL